MIFFYILSVCIFFFSLLVIFFENVLYSLLCVVCIVIGVCLILFSLSVEFLTYVYLLVYIGAIATLFLFVIMLLSTNYKRQKKFGVVLIVDFILYLIIFLKGYLVLLCFNTNLATVFFAGGNFLQSSFLVLGTTGDTVLFLNLFYYYAVYFIIIAIILLASFN
jgi:NADH-quinone oxidoreductase subunit J